MLGKEQEFFRFSPMCAGERMPQPADATLPVHLSRESPQWRQTTILKHPEDDSSPQLWLHVHPAFNLPTSVKGNSSLPATQAKNLGLISDFSVKLHIQSISKLFEPFLPNISRIYLLFTTSSAITLSKPPSPLIHAKPIKGSPHFYPWPPCSPFSTQLLE